MLTVIEGSGFFTTADSESAVEKGAMAVFEPNEIHGMRAVDAALMVLATISPRPGTR
jgi:quercetin dioxygenase-like cupin family protein